MASIEVIESTGIRDLEKNSIEAAIRALSESKGDVLETIRAGAPRQSGDLASSLSVSEVLHYGKSRVAVRFFFDEKVAPYWRQVIYGRKAGRVIRPIRKVALAFDSDFSNAPSSRDGRSIFKRVTQGPMKANNFVRRGLREAGERITGMVGSKFIAFLRR